MTIGDDILAVWVASVPRTGSMWTYNVIRQLVRSTGRPALPEVVPQSDEEMEAIGRAGIVAGDGVYVLKVHTRIPADLPNSFFVVTRRDLRDSVVSFMRFAHADFDAALYFVASAIRLERHFATFPPERSMTVAYGDIIDRPAGVVGDLARRLGIAATPGDAAAISDRFSKGNVQARIVERERALRQKIEAQQPVDRRDFIAQADRSLRAFDVETGFQSGHVSAYREGDWRQILTGPQQAAVEELMLEADGAGDGG